MINLFIQLLVSAAVFLILSKILPGFQIKDFKTSILVAVIYGILMVVGSLLVGPLQFLSATLVKLVSWIPLIGSIANIGAIILAFLLKFIIGSIMLSITDAILKDFKMNSFMVGIVAAFIISLVGCFLPMY